MSDTVSSGYMSVEEIRPVSETDGEVHPGVILDEFKDLEEVTEAIRKQGLESCHMIFGRIFYESHKQIETYKIIHLYDVFC
jgi:hypothetical protein